MNSRLRGTAGEVVAARYLEEKGYVVLARNVYAVNDEIDIVAKDGDYIVFVEVKTRKNFKHGFACEAVTMSKIKRLSRAAVFYLSKQNLLDADVRFDIVEFYSDSGAIEHIINAFEPCFKSEF